MRGILPQRFHLTRQLGIIPAHAGHTVTLFSICSRAWDHPRTCGAYNNVASISMPFQGSSPHMRGILILIDYFVFFDGIIPAHAGHTRQSCQEGPAYRDHPRTCGAYYNLVRLDDIHKGSSPHMRGIQVMQTHLRGNSGIIPAHAGHTSRCLLLYQRRRDHPRTCGAYHRRRSSFRAGPGSSPHMRGMHHLLVLGGRLVGIIPAHAGHTGH